MLNRDQAHHNVLVVRSSCDLINYLGMLTVNVLGRGGPNRCVCRGSDGAMAFFQRKARSEIRIQSFDAPAEGVGVSRPRMRSR